VTLVEREHPPEQIARERLGDTRQVQNLSHHQQHDKAAIRIQRVIPGHLDTRCMYDAPDRLNGCTHSLFVTFRSRILFQNRKRRR
jgi:hypothetical protein